ncbi:hypothetical protein M569_04993 [Genlisea aurea]|uniref:Uncharacterized protein n=1 Tax=Genlisea aurea TaxID=192259 RepID=S8CXL1_9LAMI|nr:hypothetical protein M569_04993 [Genlisea aurea]
MGLDDAIFSTVCSQILAEEPLPGFNQIYNRIIREEQHRNIKRSEDPRSDAVAMAVRRTAEERSSKIKSDKPCSVCGFSGHDKDGCFVLLGYPEWWGDRPRYQFDEKGKLVQCGGGPATSSQESRNRGGISRRVTGRGRGRGGSRSNGSREETAVAGPSTLQAHAATGGQVVSAESRNLTLTNEDKQQVTSLSESQWRKLEQILARKDDSEKLSACSITIPNGQQEVSRISGTDRASKEMIGIGEPVGRVYRLLLVKDCSVNSFLVA